MYKIKSITPKYQKSDNTLLWYNILVENEKWTYNFSDFYSVVDIKKTFWVENPDGAKLLVWKEVNLITTIELKK